MDNLELVSFQIISAVGVAKSSYIEAIQKAKQKDFEAAEKLIADGKECFTQAHHIHSELLQKDASGRICSRRAEIIQQSLNYRQK